MSTDLVQLRPQTLAKLHPIAHQGGKLVHHIRMRFSQFLEDDYLIAYHAHGVVYRPGSADGKPTCKGSAGKSNSSVNIGDHGRNIVTSSATVNGGRP